MTMTEKIKILCVRSGITLSELARRIGQSSPNFFGKMKRESFTHKELQQMAEAVGAKYEYHFVLPDGDKI